MHFLVIGASGRSGKLVVEEALRKGHQVTGLVRNETSLTKRDGLTTVTGSPMNIEDIVKALNTSQIDVVIITLSQRRASDSPFAALDPSTPPHLIADSVRNTLTAMRGANPPVRKIVLMSAVGTGESMTNLNFIMRLTFSHTNMRYSREDHDAADQELRKATGIDFVEVRPWMLTDGEAAEVKVYDDDGKGAGFMPKISRASVARFIVEAAATTKYDGRAPVITN